MRITGGFLVKGGRGARRLAGLTIALGLLLLGATSTATSAFVGEGCANEARRIEQGSTFLPECRAYELVSPPDGTPYLEEHPESNYEPTWLPRSLGVRASSLGGRIAWYSLYPVSSSPGGGYYDLSTRGSGGWANVDTTPGLSTTNSLAVACKPLMFFAADLSKGVLTDGMQSAGSGGATTGGSSGGVCGANDPTLVEGEPEGFQNVFLRDTATGGYSLANVTPADVAPGNAYFQDASDDFSHLLFADEAELTHGAPAGASLYELAGGAVHLVTVLPDGTLSTGSLPGAVNNGNEKGTAPITHPMSADGTRVVFENFENHNLYLRENVEQAEESALGPGGECLESAKACTVQLDASQAGGTGGGGAFLAANAEDTKVFFTDDAGAGLTADTVPGSGQNLYEYDTQTSVLTDLTPAGELGLSGLSAISDDGSYLYLVATGALIGNATAGQPNLYVFHAGSVRLIATLAGGKEEQHDWLASESTARVSLDGRYLGFNSGLSLTGYDNNDPVTGEALFEVFLYDAVANTLACISCDPSGTPPSGPALIPVADESSQSPSPVYVSRNVLDDGRVFFDSADPIASGAVNGKTNVYEYAGGHISLISTGVSSESSFFLDTGADGGDVYFATSQHLVRGDTATGQRLYDARAGGGFPEAQVPPSPCAGEECRAPVGGLPVFAAPVSVGFQGSGNPRSQPVSKPAVRALTRKQKLQRSLARCRREKNRRKRAACVRRAQEHNGVRPVTVKRGGGK
jgi:hypothetical protein